VFLSIDFVFVAVLIVVSLLALLRALRTLTLALLTIEAVFAFEKGF
jgi:hypothetical protein